MDNTFSTLFATLANIRPSNVNYLGYLLCCSAWYLAILCSRILVYYAHVSCYTRLTYLVIPYFRCVVLALSSLKLWCKPFWRDYSLSPNKPRCFVKIMMSDFRKLLPLVDLGMRNVIFLLFIHNPIEVVWSAFKSHVKRGLHHNMNEPL